MRGKRPLEGLGAAEFLLRDEGREQQINRVEYVPPVESWRQEDTQSPRVRICIIAEPHRLGDTAERVNQQLKVVFAEPYPRGLGALPFGVEVSLFGLPFTTHPEDLARILPDAAKAGHWTGHEFAGLLPPGTDDTQIRWNPELSRTFALPRYLELVERLGRFPGKKIVVLLRNDFAANEWSEPFLRELAARCFRNRVTFHAADSYFAVRRVLEEPSLLAKLVQLTDGGMWVRGGRVADYSSARDQDEFPKPPRETLEVQQVLQDAVKSAGGYYLLTYTPDPAEPSGPFHSLEIVVKRSGVKATALPGYFVPGRGQVARPEALALYEAFGSAAVGPAPVQIRFAYTPDTSGTILLSASVNLRPSDLTLQPDEKGRAAEFTTWARVVDLQGERLSPYREVIYHEALPELQWERMMQDPRAFLQYNLGMRVVPGRQRFQLAWKENRSGRIGRFEREIEVPDLTLPSSPSDLFLNLEYLTSDQPRPARLGPRPPDRQTPLYNRLVAYEKNREFASSPDDVFRQGETIVARYGVSQATAEDFDSAKGLQISVWAPEASLPAWQGKVAVRAALKSLSQVSFDAQIPTAELAPGRYSVQAELPLGARRRQAHIERQITIVRD